LTILLPFLSYALNNPGFLKMKNGKIKREKKGFLKKN